MLNILKNLIRYINPGKTGGYRWILLLLVSLLIITCVEPFEPKIDEYESALVVEGMITNLPGSCEVKLTRSYPYNSTNYQRVSQAEVKVIDDLGNETQLKYYQSGRYKVEDETFAGVIGRKYKVWVKTNQGEECESEFEELKEPIDIDSVYYEFKERPHYDDTGIQIYLDTHDPQNSTYYYTWKYTETWVFDVPYPVPSLKNVQTCYHNETPYVFLLGTSIENTSDELKKFPLYFINDNTNRLFKKYSVVVRQYTLTEKTYLFLKALENVSEDVGSLFDEIPETSYGNVRSVSDSDEPILGNFQVSGVSSKRIFINRTDLPSTFNPPSEFEYCEQQMVYVTQTALIDSLKLDGWMIIDTLPAMNENPAQYDMVFNYKCIDCTTNGTNETPSFWYENE